VELDEMKDLKRSDFPISAIKGKTYSQSYKKLTVVGNNILQ